MTLADCIARFESLAAQHGQPQKINLVRYATFADWHLPSEEGPATEADFISAQRLTDEFAERLTRRGVDVGARLFHRAEYDRWRGDRPDTRNLRAEWASIKVTFGFKISADAIGWAVLESADL